MDAEAAAQATAGSYLRSLLERVADHAKQHSTKLFSGLAVLYLAIATIVVIALLSSRYRFETVSLIIPIFYGALYLRRRLRPRGRYQHAWLRRGLWYLTVSSGALMSLLLFVSLPPAIGSWQKAIGAWLLLTVAAYCFYRILILHLEMEEHAAAQVQAQAAVPPV